MAHWSGEAGFRWRPLQPFGVELDCELSRPLPREQAARFVELLWTHGLVLARGQRLSMERQRDGRLAATSHLRISSPPRR